MNKNTNKGTGGTSVACPYANKCGGCDYQGIDYKEQLNIKQRELKKLLGSFGPLDKVVACKDPYHYRNKVTGTYGYLKSGEYISGVYEKNSHRLVKIDDCQITDEKANKIILTIRGLLKSFKIKTYNEDSGYGLLRHVLVRVGKNSGQVLVVLVCSSPVFPSKNNFVKALRDKHPEVSTVVLNVNDRHTSQVLGSRNITLYGRGFIEDKLCGLTFRISPNSFYQVNTAQTEILYNLAIKNAGLKATDTLLDAYSGIGTIGLVAASEVKKVISVELNRDAHKDAITNAKLNGIKNVQFYNEDATEFIEKVAATGTEKIDVVIMDPPRTGSTNRFMDAVVKLAPERVVYVSCDPNTLARDLKYITRKGYEVKSMTPVDMFCFTGHVETVVLMTRK